MILRDAAPKIHPPTETDAPADDPVPAELRELKRWVVWRQAAKQKIPVSPTTGFAVSAFKPNNWLNHGAAVQAHKRHRNAVPDKRIDGIGFVFDDDTPYVGIDFDTCITPTGELTDWSRPWVGELALVGAYLEISPSKAGIKAWVRGKLPASVKALSLGDHVGVEVYGGGASPRFFTVTGDVYVDPPDGPIPDGQKAVDELVRWMDAENARLQAAAATAAPGASQLGVTSQPTAAPTSTATTPNPARASLSNSTATTRPTAPTTAPNPVRPSSPNSTATTSPTTAAANGLRLTANDGPTVEERAVAYLATIEAAVSGQKGSNPTLRAACIVGPGFNLDEETTFRLLWTHYNPRCQPPWSEKELRHKVDSAFKREPRRGWKLDEPPPPPPGKQPSLATAADPGAPITYATLADVAKMTAAQRWFWPGWMPSGVLTAIAAEPGTGKTRLALDLARRLWFKLPFPDGQANLFPAETRTLWVPGDQNHGELVTAAGDFGLPAEAVCLGAPPDDPFGALDLDDHQNIDAIARRVEASGCPVVFVDTIGMTTRRKLFRPEEAREFFGPLMEAARRTGAAWATITHLSKGGDPLDRRIVEKARAVIKLNCPDPDGQPNRRKLWVAKSATIKPPALGVTMGSAGNEYDDNPPQEPESSPKRGPAPQKTAACEEWLREALTPNPARVCDLRKEANGKGFSSGTLYNARDALSVSEYRAEGYLWWRLPDPNFADD